MRTYDFSPHYRSTVGFDRLFDMLDQTARAETSPNWPPYNIERTGEDDYRITMALAGFFPVRLSSSRRKTRSLLQATRTRTRNRAQKCCIGGLPPGPSARASTLLST